jgi:hypothetical protein
MKESSLAQQCLDILRREDVKTQIKLLFSPVYEFMSTEIYPYVYLIFGIVFLIFVMVLAILVILILILRNKKFFEKIMELPTE